MANFITQASSNVGKNQAARDVNDTTIHNHYATFSTQVNTLLESLENEINNNATLKQNMDEYSEYVDRRSEAKIIGLEQKIKETQLNINLKKAIEKKEIFYKLMTKYSEFESAQKLFVYFFSCIRDVFDERIEPNINKIQLDEYNNIVDEYIVNVIMRDLGKDSNLLIINRNHIRGMIYFLADRCFVQWTSNEQFII